MTELKEFRVALQKDLLDRYKFSVTKLAFKHLIPRRHLQAKLDDKQQRDIRNLTVEFGKAYNLVAQNMYSNQQMLNFMKK